MSPLILFVFGVFVFLITVYGTVTVGGLLLTNRQIVDNPDLATSDDDAEAEPASAGAPDGLRRIVPADY